MALREVPISHIILLMIRWFFDFCSSSAGPTFRPATIRMMSSTAMQVSPRKVSHSCTLWMSLKMFFQISMNVVPLAVIPSTSFTCDVTIISETADVNPDETGPDTKSTRNPSPKMPISSSTRPERKQSRIDFPTLPPAVWKVSSDAIAVGPIGTSLQLPNTMYTMQPRNDPYKPYAAGRPAIPA
uniref:Putative secreted protein n=1 Tax=Anopheles triannulatus TaxID=58253 RepID=A0A2M4AJ50_9DIPT